ncbi:MAG: NADH-quinone oxidoreductase subunit G [Chromatiales bacterium]|nr:MAG: NADH-quinone oxidoreductase subunit G [Chromatiales bacterium]
MTDEQIEIEVNGQTLTARPGQMLIEVTDAAGIYIPRFCYHENLSIAANCRMCLVEVENVAKPLPACATPVTPGMKVSTKSDRAIDAQKATMEFLLINHPLDCPICDQGGECELQDLAMGFGRGVSRYTEGKRAVPDQDLGPLVSTDMTRCIHCTRCVRFGQEVAGIQELGAIGRGEKMEISTYIQQSVDHELSGNIIDLCPVGALNNKPYRFSARAWEMTQHDAIGPHDCVGANLHLHVLDGRVKRVVPKRNEALNETWASDRDRFSYEGIYADDRVTTPLVRRDGELRPCDWDEALAAAADALRAGGADTGALVSPNATVEEGFLLAQLLGHLGSASIDHRLRRRDFRAQDADPVFPWLGMTVADVENLDALLVVGSHLREEVPLLAHRVRKAARQGARVYFLNSESYRYLFPVAGQRVAADLVAGIDQVGAGDDVHRALQQGDNAAVLLGQIAMRHPRFAELRQGAAQLAANTGARLGYIPEGANAAGLSLIGALPHRGPGGQPRPAGRHAGELLNQPPSTLVLLGIEPEHDCAVATAASALEQAGRVIAITPFLAGSMAAHADIVLPVGSFAETAGTFVNAAGDWQSFAAAAVAVGDSRPGWKVLRVLGNLLQLPGCSYATAAEVLDAARAAAGTPQPDNALAASAKPGPPPAAAGDDNLHVPIYRADALVRRAGSLQQTSDGLAGGGAPANAGDEAA